MILGSRARTDEFFKTSGIKAHELLTRMADRRDGLEAETLEHNRYGTVRVINLDGVYILIELGNDKSLARGRNKHEVEVLPLIIHDYGPDKNTLKRHVQPELVYEPIRSKGYRANVYGSYTVATNRLFYFRGQYENDHDGYRLVEFHKPPILHYKNDDVMDAIQRIAIHLRYEDRGNVRQTRYQHERWNFAMNFGARYVFTEYDNMPLYNALTFKQPDYEIIFDNDFNQFSAFLWGNKEDFDETLTLSILTN
jgi:hypothetical protein